MKVHAGGVAWHGHYLYVADTGQGMRVFDLRRILKTSTRGTAAQIGRQSDKVYYAHNYAYVLPQVGTVKAATTSGTPLVWSSVSLDRPSRSLVMNEYTCASGCAKYPNRAPRAVRFPFAGWVSGGESISYWEDATKPDLLWSLQEQENRRNVFTVKQATYSP